MADVGPLIDSEDRWIAQYIAGDLDRHGILGRTIADVAEALGTGIDRIEKVVGVFRRVISPGLCAANLRESLLLHVLAHTSGSWATLLAAIIQDHLNDAATNNLDAIARATQTDTGTVRQALDFLRERIPAYPLYDEEEPPPAGSCEDVIVRWSEEDQPQGLSIEVVDHGWSRLRIDDVYADIAHRSSLQPPPNIGRGSWTEIQDQVRRAQELLDLVHGRTNTLGRVAREAATYQWRFLREGKRFHRPLTRAQVADTLDLHESTVSRCVAGKSIRMPDGTVQPLTVLFGGAVSTQTALAELIRAEQSALSDASLAEQLTQLGHPVCRRTVAKYRALLDIPAQAGRQQRLRLPATGAV